MEGKKYVRVNVCVYVCVCVSVHTCVGAHLCFHEAKPLQANYSLCFCMLIMAGRTMHTLSERMQKLLRQRGKVGRTIAIFSCSLLFITKSHSTAAVMGLWAAGKGSYCCLDIQLEMQH